MADDEDEQAGTAAADLLTLSQLYENLPSRLRDGRLSPPPPDWTWKPRVYMGDSARAGSNALKAVCEDPEDLANTSIHVLM